MNDISVGNHTKPTQVHKSPDHNTILARTSRIPDSQEDSSDFSSARMIPSSPPLLGMDWEDDERGPPSAQPPSRGLIDFQYVPYSRVCYLHTDKRCSQVITDAPPTARKNLPQQETPVYLVTETVLCARATSVINIHGVYRTAHRAHAAAVTEFSRLAERMEDHYLHVAADASAVWDHGSNSAGVVRYNAQVSHRTEYRQERVSGSVGDDVWFVLVKTKEDKGGDETTALEGVFGSAEMAAAAARERLAAFEGKKVDGGGLLDAYSGIKKVRGGVKRHVFTARRRVL